MRCPLCNAHTRVLSTRVSKTGENAMIRRHECFNEHRFTTEERVKLDTVAMITKQLEKQK
jgi:transcriptional regulator NrdR family protein